MFDASSASRPRRDASDKARVQDDSDPVRIGGVAIDVDASHEPPRFIVQLLSRALVPVGTVAVTTEESAARRVWLLLARTLGEPRYIACPGGGFRALDRLTGPVVGREPLQRRPPRTGGRRRPPSRRRTVSQPIPFASHTGEREIIAYE